MLKRRCPPAILGLCWDPACCNPWCVPAFCPHRTSSIARAPPSPFARIPLPPAAPYVPALSLYHFLDWRWVSFSSFRGWMVSVATFTNALLAAVYLRLIVRGCLRG